MTIKNIQSLESILVRKYLTVQLSVSSEIHQLFIINGENVFFLSKDNNLEGMILKSLGKNMRIKSALSKAI